MVCLDDDQLLFARQAIGAERLMAANSHRARVVRARPASQSAPYPGGPLEVINRFDFTARQRAIEGGIDQCGEALRQGKQRVVCPRFMRRGINQACVIDQRNGAGFTSYTGSGCQSM